jgi:Mg-chelatase subunit ChlD
VIGRCGDGISCNALWAKMLSTVSLPAALANGSNGNPTDPEIIESACYSRLAEPFMIDQYQDAEDYWAKYSVQPSWAYFGAHNGLFRKIPAVHQEQCGLYDHRRRPWFVAASSGPKDVVLVLDSSGSMNDYGRMAIAKEAAITVVETLTVADRVAVIAFSDKASQIGGYDKLIRATSENKARLIEAIKQLKANGATNFYDAFDHTFKALDKTIQNESTSGCNIAVLFMTDGQITAGLDDSEVIDLVNERTEELATNFNRKTTVFAFSLGLQADHDTTKKIACSTNGIWTPVDDQTGDLVSAMSSYYKLYALGLGDGGNNDFAAWVEPYAFANPAGKTGTTVSVPVYDRSVSPPLFLGVVAIDIYMDAFEKILGEQADSSRMLDRFVQLSTARCPKIELTECELDALRFLGGGEEATCGVCNATTYAGIVPEKCPFQSDWPNNLYHNTEMEGKSFEDRACCEVGTNVPSDVCPAISTKSFNEGQDTSSSNIQYSNTGLIVGIVVAVVVVALIVLVLYHRRTRTITVIHKVDSKNTNETKANATCEPSNDQQTNPTADSNSSLYVGLSVMAPSAPANPAYIAN